MAKDNGGIIGVLNTPSTSLASGVWALEDQYQAKLGGTWPAPYNLGSNSARFNSGSSDYLNRTTASQTAQKFTFNCWFKISSNFTGRRVLFGTDYSTNANFSGQSGSSISIWQDSTILVGGYGGLLSVVSTQLIRDPSAWYNLVWSVDTTQATASNRMKIYLNGSQITSFSSSLYPNQNQNIEYKHHSIGSYSDQATYGGSQNYTYFYDGYISEAYLVDGQQLDATSFGQTDTTTGIWIPKAYTGTYGTNGFYLNFSNASSLGTDSSGNGNNFTVNNLTSVDQSKDNPTNNWATMNPLRQPTGNPATLTNGNLTVTTQSTGYYGGRSTIPMTSGKWYFEAKLVSQSSGNIGYIGIQNADSYTPEMFNSSSGAFAGYSSTGWSYYGGTGVYTNNNTDTAYGTSYTANDIISVALDCDNAKLYFAKNGTWQNSGVPTSGATGTGAISITSGLTYLFAVDDGSNTASVVWDANFGQPQYSVSGGYSDTNGYGNFTYQPPSGYLALCTNNLASNG